MIDLKYSNWRFTAQIKLLDYIPQEFQLHLIHPVDSSARLSVKSPSTSHLCPIKIKTQVELWKKWYVRIEVV